MAIRGLLDLLLVEAGFDRRYGAALLVDTTHQRPRLLHQRMCQRLDEV